MRLFARCALFFGCLGLGSITAAGCTLFQSDAPMPGGADGSADGTVGDGSPIPVGDAAAEGGASYARVRIAYFPGSTGAASGGVDLCLDPADGGASPAVPLLQSVFAKGLVAANQVSAYVPVAPGAYAAGVLSIRAAGAGTCGTGAEVRVKQTPYLGAGQSFTLFITGGGADAGGPTATFELDEVDTAHAEVRFLSALQEPATYGLGGGVAFQSLTFDGNQYATPPLAVPATTHIDSTLQVGTTVLASGDLNLAPGKRVTAFAYDAPGADGGTSAPALLTCDDDAVQSGSAWLGACVPGSAPAPSSVRFANFVASPLPSGVDLCLRYSGMPTFAAPAPSGALYAVPSVSPYVPLRAGFSYDVALTTSGSSCASPVTGSQGTFALAAPNTQGTTLGVMGYLATVAPDAGVADAGDAGDASVDASDAGDAATDATDAAQEAASDAGDAAPPPTSGGLVYQPFPDYAGATALPVVRVINASPPGTSALNVIASYKSTVSSWNFNNVPPGAVGASASGALDSQGFLPVKAGTGTLDVLPSRFLFTIGAADHDTYLLFGGGDAGANVMACVEQSGSDGGAPTSACSVLAPQ